MIDPVSQNAVPPGALPKEVRDDRPIMASEGEYVIPADVVRYLGLEKIESIVNKAKEGLAEKHAQGRIGGQPLGAQAAERAQAAPPREGRPMAPPAAPMQRPPGMATGGMVSTQGPQPPQMVAYVSPSGQTTYIPFVNGQPIVTIPQGYVKSTAQPVAPAQSVVGGSTSGGQSTFGKLAAADVKSPNEWSVQDFINYGDSITSPIGGMVRGAVGAMVPGARWMDRLAQNNVDKQVPTMLDNMIETGVDANGQPISDADVQGLIKTREAMRDQLAQESGQPANPFERVSSFVSRLLGGNPGQSENASTQGPQDGQASSPSRSDNATISGMLTAAPDKQQKDGGMKSGFSSGGLVSKPVSYAKGGLVTKRC